MRSTTAWIRASSSRTCPSIRIDVWESWGSYYFGSMDPISFSGIICSKCEVNDAIPGRRWCLECASYMRAAKERHRNKPRSEGLCRRSDCPNPATPGLTSCQRCRERTAEYEKRNRTKLQFEARQTRRRLRTETFEKYGGSFCACCGEDYYEFLTMDHIDGSGADHRRQMGTKTDIYHWLKKNNYPPGFRVLCMNCNFALGYHGYCPHNGWVQPTGNGRLGRPARKKEE